jgi:hypothetical protein
MPLVFLLLLVIWCHCLLGLGTLPTETFLPICLVISGPVVMPRRNRRHFSGGYPIGCPADQINHYLKHELPTEFYLLCRESTQCVHCLLYLILLLYAVVLPVFAVAEIKRYWKCGHTHRRSTRL